jgi:hypothetical protein
MRETSEEAMERLKDLPLKVGMLMVAQDSTSSILMVCGVHKNTPEDDGDKSMHEFCWMNRGGRLTRGGSAYDLSIISWAVDHRADYLYHLCVNDLGNFPKKEQEV